jgi:outer membrane lipoprotein-sorting protein
MKMMLHSIGLILITMFCISCKEQSQAKPPQSQVKSKKPNYTEAQLKEADTTNVPMSMVRRVKTESEKK